MHCPNDNTVLQMTNREGIEIDYCPTCRGVWLDRGELDKLIERSRGSYGGYPNEQRREEHYGRDDDRRKEYGHDDDDDDEHYGRQNHHQGGSHNQHHKKREGFLGDLFDF